jgi:hypothetical protein
MTSSLQSVAQDRPISERDIYRRALAASVIDDSAFAQLQALYDERNRVIHRYIITRITTSEVLDIAIRYQHMIEALHKRLWEIEERQIRENVGITVRGPELRRRRSAFHGRVFRRETHSSIGKATASARGTTWRRLKQSGWHDRALARFSFGCRFALSFAARPASPRGERARVRSQRFAVGHIAL